MRSETMARRIRDLEDAVKLLKEAVFDLVHDLDEADQGPD